LGSPPGKQFRHGRPGIDRIVDRLRRDHPDPVMRRQRDDDRGLLAYVLLDKDDAELATEMTAASGR